MASSINIFNFKTSIAKISKLIDDEVNKNVTFIFNDSDIKVKAHKFMLKIISPVFRAMFSSNFVEKDVVLISDITPEVFDLLIK